MATLAERAAAAQARLQPKTEQREERNTLSAPVKLSKALQAEADYDGAIERIELDGLAVLKILQHASGALNSVAGATASSLSGPGQQNAAGFLLGLALGDRLSISNAFPLPASHLLPSSVTTLSSINIPSSQNTDERAKAAKVASEREKEVDNAYRNARNFVSTYLPRAKELNLDSEVVGGYFVTRDGLDLLKEGLLVDILIRYEYGLGAGQGANAAGANPSLSSVAGAGKATSANSRLKSASRLHRRAVAIVHNASSSTSSTLSLKAYSLSPAFIQLYESSSTYNVHKFDYASLASAGLTPSNMLVSYPVSVTSSSLLTAYMSANPDLRSLNEREQKSSFSSLSANESLENNLRSLIGTVDSANSSIQSLGYQGRAAKYGGASAAQGTADSLNRLDSLKTMAVADGAAKALGQEAGLGTVRAWAARSSVVQ